MPWLTSMGSHAGTWHHACAHTSIASNVRHKEAASLTPPACMHGLATVLGMLSSICLLYLVGSQTHVMAIMEA